MAIAYKKRCPVCKTNYVLVSGKMTRVCCYDCQKKELEGEIKDPEMKKMFDIPEEYYAESAFLRDIKVTYLRFENLSEKQIEAFKKTVQKLDDKKKETN